MASSALLGEKPTVRSIAFPFFFFFSFFSRLIVSSFLFFAHFAFICFSFFVCWRGLLFLGEVVAYKAQALPSVTSVTDVISQLYQGKSMVFSAARCFQLASSLGVHQYLTSENADWNAFTIYFERSVQTFLFFLFSFLILCSLFFFFASFVSIIECHDDQFDSCFDSLVVDEEREHFQDFLLSKFLFPIRCQCQHCCHLHRN
jgi:hypothetical protein